MAALTKSRHRRFDERGNAVLELAFTLPLLLIVVMAIFDFGLMFQRYEVLTNAAREGARVGVLPGYTTTDAQTRAEQYLTSGGLSGTVVATAGTVAVGTPPVTTGSVTVTVTYTHQFIWVGPLLNLFSTNLGSVTLTAVSTMRGEAS